MSFLEAWLGGGGKAWLDGEVSGHGASSKSGRCTEAPGGWDLSPCVCVGGLSLTDKRAPLPL